MAKRRMSILYVHAEWFILMTPAEVADMYFAVLLGRVPIQCTV